MIGNLGHYIRELIRGNSFFTPKLIYKYTIIALGIMHIVNGVLFMCSASFLLMFIHVAAAALFFTTFIPMLEKHELINIYLLMLLEVVVLSFFNNLALGWNSGFSTYFFTAVASTFYFSYLNSSRDGSRHALPFGLSLLIILCYLFNYFLMSHVTPLLPVASPFLSTLTFLANTVAGFGAVIAFFYLFIWEISHKNRILTDQNALLDELAKKDPLTKLLNRRSMNSILNDHMEQLKKTGKRFTLILGDIDDFKKINDTFGHDAGDMVLVKVSDTINMNVSINDAVCRWGGEEILILVHEPVEMASLKAEKIRKAIEAATVSFEGIDIGITMTFGVAESLPGYKIEHLIQQADDKLYFGKKHGKNQVVTDLRPL